MGKLFGTDGIRGRAYEYPVTTEMATRLGAAVVAMMGGEESVKVLIGRDTRESGTDLENALEAGLLGVGAEVVKLGVVPTPALAVLVKHLGATAAVMITASHNPFEDNGMKIFGGDGFKLPDGMEEEIEGLLLADDTPGITLNGGSSSDFPEGIETYVERAKSSIGCMSLSGLKLVLDAGNGAGFAVSPRIFRELGAEVIEMAVSPNGRNINEGCGALHADRAGQLVKENGADFGVSLDGDADRVIFTTSGGDVVSGDRVLAMCALGLKQDGKLPGDAIVATVMSNLGLDEAMRKEGVRVIRVGVGDRMVLERMRADGIAFGGENSGHLIFADYTTTGDGILSALQICRMVLRTGKSLAELASVMDEYPSELRNLYIPEKPPLDGLPKLQALIAEAEREFGGDGRQLIRYSGTENKIRILVEHKHAAEVERWVGKFEEVIREEIG
tara:strand:+ start:9203 stop:10537 length:1335 start_codon:yes stop_codon:yes gene_type:complete